jgi:hypothetical protein
MVHIKEYRYFNKNYKVESEGSGLVVSFKYETNSGDRFIIFYMSTGPNFIKCVEGIVYDMIDSSDYQLRIDKINSKNDLIDILKSDIDLKKAISKKIQDFYRIEEDTVKVYELTPRDHKKEEVNRFTIKSKIKSSYSYDPNNMRDSDDEDSIPYPGWETDGVLSNLYRMFKPERDLFRKIASQ